jgi:hypothetical protein
MVMVAAGLTGCHLSFRATGPKRAVVESAILLLD